MDRGDIHRLLSKLLLSKHEELSRNKTNREEIDRLWRRIVEVMETALVKRGASRAETEAAARLLLAYMDAASSKRAPDDLLTRFLRDMQVKGGDQ